MKLIGLTRNYIAIDSLAPAQPLARGKSYDGVAEKLIISSRMRQAVTLDFFYGTNAYTNAEKLQLLLKSDKALDLQEAACYYRGCCQSGHRR